MYFVPLSYLRLVALPAGARSDRLVAPLRLLQAQNHSYRSEYTRTCMSSKDEFDLVIYLPNPSYWTHTFWYPHFCTSVSDRVARRQPPSFTSI